MAEGINLGKAWVQIVPSAEGFSGKLKGIVDSEATQAGVSGGGKLSGALGGALKMGGAAIAAGMAAATTAVVSFGKEAVSSYAEYEQLAGGVEKLYGTAADKIKNYADEAYKTSGMSANAYMETATSFSAALIGDLKGDVNKAADLTDVAMRAMSDNVNVFGSDMQSVQNAFQGFAKGQYNMLDNLKLGYGGTKTEMERLIKDANTYRKSIGESADLSIDSFADIVQAIQSVQEAQNIAGTTNKEAMSTIEGSATATKAAWDNLITSIGRGEGINESFNALLTSLFGEGEGEGLLNQIIPRIETVMQGIGDFILQAAPILSEKIPPLIQSIVPSLLSGAATLISALAQGLLAALPTLMPIATDILMSIITGIVNNLPMILSTGVELIMTLVSGISESLPTLIPAMVNAILTMVDGLLNNIPMLIDCAIKLITGLATGLVNALPILIEKGPTIVGKLVVGIIAAIPQLVTAGGKLIMAIIEGCAKLSNRIIEAGRNIPEGFKQGFMEAWENFRSWVVGKVQELIASVKSSFQIASPSKVFAQIGDYCVQGFDEGFATFGDDALDQVNSVVDEITDQSGNIVSDVTSVISGDISTSANKAMSASGGDDNAMLSLLSRYLPMLENVGNTTVTLEGDADGLFRQIRNEAKRFAKSTGYSPFPA